MSADHAPPRGDRTRAAGCVRASSPNRPRHRARRRRDRRDAGPRRPAHHQPARLVRHRGAGRGGGTFTSARARPPDPALRLRQGGAARPRPSDRGAAGRQGAALEPGHRVPGRADERAAARWLADRDLGARPRRGGNILGAPDRRARHVLRQRSRRVRRQRLRAHAARRSPHPGAAVLLDARPRLRIRRVPLARIAPRAVSTGPRCCSPT